MGLKRGQNPERQILLDLKAQEKSPLSGHSALQAHWGGSITPHCTVGQPAFAGSLEWPCPSCLLPWSHLTGLGQGHSGPLKPEWQAHPLSEQPYPGGSGRSKDLCPDDL